MTNIGSLATKPLLGLPLAELWFALLFFIFGMFLFLDGFDFGVGVLFATRDNDHEKEQLLAAVGPFWDGNEVWLVVFGGALFAAFPSVYANLFSRYYLLMFAILAALGLRGLAPEMYEEREDDRWRTFWGYSFVIGSTVTPFLLGLFVINWLVGATGLITPVGVLGGVTVLALTIVDGAAFLGLKTRGALRDEMRNYGVRAAVGYLGGAIITLGAIYVTEPGLRSSFRSPLIVALVILTATLTGIYVVALRRNRYYAAFAATAALVFGLVGVVAILLFPFVDQTAGLTIRDAVISTLPLNLMSIMASVLLPIVIGYFVVLYSAFSGPVNTEETYG
ncbi:MULTISPECIES: cytochrome d ubiquinol oxidase subunit II [unclassified Haloferax]|uniref:cytochrome d ubiquinol oxidase subunit II n=1 Tax=unclassified Haloferax TaxID=2625095 RepID=UPI0028763537|nr:MULTISPECIES: cytochrome d ubiquinol oxidase subunit II [unclassified Haloferax]MDS0243708.1 cytochrome d ubiquinol oxidase subunit II [Haloferax sp. S2CR25]MDS0446829.1 cytochrome d ubiquinol oxidase subunit II [Haloferax sp. S2CR25-2]